MKLKEAMCCRNAVTVAAADSGRAPVYQVLSIDKRNHAGHSKGLQPRISRRMKRRREAGGEGGGGEYPADCALFIHAAAVADRQPHVLPVSEVVDALTEPHVAKALRLQLITHSHPLVIK